MTLKWVIVVRMIKNLFKKRPSKRVRDLAYKFLELKFEKLIVYDSFKDGTKDGLLLTHPNGKVVMLAGAKKEMYYDKKFFEQMTSDLDLFFGIKDIMFFHLWVRKKYDQFSCKRFEFYYQLNFPFFLDEKDIK